MLIGYEHTEITHVADSHEYMSITLCMEQDEVIKPYNKNMLIHNGEHANSTVKRPHTCPLMSVHERSKLYKGLMFIYNAHPYIMSADLDCSTLPHSGSSHLGNCLMKL